VSQEDGPGFPDSKFGLEVFYRLVAAAALFKVKVGKMMIKENVKHWELPDDYVRGPGQVYSRSKSGLQVCIRSRLGAHAVADKYLRDRPVLRNYKVCTSSARGSRLFPCAPILASN
jgi:hypothetical protein